MPGLRITILTPDTNQAQRAARRLKTLLAQEGVLAHVQEVTCYLELSRQGLKGKPPVISVEGRMYQFASLEDSVLAQFASWLARGLKTNNEHQGERHEGPAERI